MQKSKITAIMLIYSIVSYIFYLIAFIFIKKSEYYSGIIFFTPVIIYSAFKIKEIQDKNKVFFLFYMMIPFIISSALTLNKILPAWEVTGIFPIIFLLSLFFSNKNDKSIPIILENLKKHFFTLLSILLLFSTIHFIKTGSFNHAIYLFISAYSPALIIVPLMSFIVFLIETTTSGIILNSGKLFKQQSPIKRIIFDGTDFLNLEQYSLKEIVTAKNISKQEFTNKMNQLNTVSQNSEKYLNSLKNKTIFSEKIKEDVFSVSPLNLMLEDKKFTHKTIKLPQKSNNYSYIALAQNYEIIGYYIIDKTNFDNNAKIFETIKEQFNIQMVIIGKKSELTKWKKYAEFVETTELANIGQGDLLISKYEGFSPSAIKINWEIDKKNSGDIFLSKPFPLTILKIITIFQRKNRKTSKGLVFASLPLILPIFSQAFNFYLPEVSATSILLSISISIIWFMPKKQKNKKNKANKLTLN